MPAPKMTDYYYSSVFSWEMTELSKGYGSVLRGQSLDFEISAASEFVVVVHLFFPHE